MSQQVPSSLKNNSDEMNRNTDIGPPSSHQDLLSENKYLRDLVNRLNNELSVYHVKFPDQIVSATENSLTKEWNTDKQALSPLLLAYDSRINQLQGDLNRKTAEFDTIKAQLKSATLENERLKISGSNSQEYQVYNESLQDRMRILSEENDALLERLRQVGNEYAKTQEENSGLIRQLAELSDRLNETEINYSESKYLSDNVLVMKKNYEDEIERMNRDAKLIQEDNERLREDIDRLRVNLEKVHSDLQESRKTAMDLTLVYKSGVKDMEKLAAKETALIAELKRASLQSEEYASMYSQAQFEMDTMCRERLDMLATMKKLETEWVDYENRMITEQKKLNEALDREVQAKSDQHKMALCEEQLMNDIKRLESRIKQLQDRQQEIITVETEKFRHHYEQEKKRLSEELTTALFQKTEFASQVERAIREKRIAESELAKIKEYIPVELQKLQGTIEEYQTRIRRAENEKNDAIHQLESLQLKLSRENNRFEKEKQLLSEEINVLQQRIRNVERDSVETKQDRIQLFNKLHETEQKLNSQLELVEEMRLEAKNASEQMIRKFDFERRELEKRHEQSGAVIEKLNKEIQDLLTQQQKMAIKWKEEARLNTKNFERIVEELQERLQKADIRVKEANERNVKVSQLKDDLMAQTEDLKKKLAQIQTNLQITNNRASNSSQQVKILLEREHELINELKTLQRTVDQLTLENKRIQRQNKLSERRMMLALPDLTKSLQDAVNNDVIDKKITAIESFAASSVAPSDISSSNIDLKITQSL